MKTNKQVKNDKFLNSLKCLLNDKDIVIAWNGQGGFMWIDHERIRLSRINIKIIMKIKYVYVASLLSQ